jgi:hypothetical protein
VNQILFSLVVVYSSGFVSVPQKHLTAEQCVGQAVWFGMLDKSKKFYCKQEK